MLLPSDLHHREIEAAETTLGEAEMMLAADPIGALEQVSRTQESLAPLAEPPQRGKAWQPHAPASHPILDELAAAAERLRALPAGCASRGYSAHCSKRGSRSGCWG